MYYNMALRAEEGSEPGNVPGPRPACPRRPVVGNAPAERIVQAMPQSPNSLISLSLSLSLSLVVPC